MRDLSDFDEYLSEEGQSFLSKWGIRLVGLYEGTIKPNHPNEQRFVDTFKTNNSPKGASEAIWFNIIAINQLIEKCASLENSLENETLRIKGLVARIKNQDQEIKEINKPLEKEVEKLRENLKSCWIKIERYEKELNIPNPEMHSTTEKPCPICKGTGAMGNCARCDGTGYI